jgi:hypothetical protein
MDAETTNAHGLVQSLYSIMMDKATSEEIDRFGASFHVISSPWGCAIEMPGLGLYDSNQDTVYNDEEDPEHDGDGIDPFDVPLAIKNIVDYARFLIRVFDDPPQSARRMGGAFVQGLRIENTPPNVHLYYAPPEAQQTFHVEDLLRQPPKYTGQGVPVILQNLQSANMTEATEVERYYWDKGWKQSEDKTPQANEPTDPPAPGRRT